MGDRLEIRRWIAIKQPAYAVALSGDGQYIAVGSEQGVTLFSIAGQRLLTYPTGGEAFPVQRLAAPPDLSQIYVGARQGQLVRLDREKQNKDFKYQAHFLYHTENDLRSLALSADNKFVALGHLSSTLTLLQTDGQLLWRATPTVTKGRSSWTVAFSSDGSVLYTGSANHGTNRLAALETQSGSLRHYLKLTQSRITFMEALPDEYGVAIGFIGDNYTGRLVVYPSDLADIIWERTFDEPITALSADSQQPVLVIGVGYEGQINLLDAHSGQILAGEQVKSTVNDLAMVQGYILAAVTQDGNLVLMDYLSEKFYL